jgi:ABC-type nickel/cobalt efflux system permease component RcnA
MDHNYTHTQVKEIRHGTHPCLQKMGTLLMTLYKWITQWSDHKKNRKTLLQAKKSNLMMKMARYHRQRHQTATKNHSGTDKRLGEILEQGCFKNKHAKLPKRAKPPHKVCCFVRWTKKLHPK